MKSDKKLSAILTRNLAVAVFAAVGLSATVPVEPALAAPVTATVQDGNYDQDTVPKEYDLYSLDPKLDRGEYSTRRGRRSDFEKRVTDALSGGALGGSGRDDATNWIGRVIMAEMTLNNPDVLTQLGSLRTDLFRRYINAASPTNRGFVINNIVVPKAAQIAKGNYHPAARVNAVQILNWLDTREGVSGSQLPSPSRQALGELVGLVNDANTPEYLVATAMGGIQRQAQLDGQVPTAEKMSGGARNAIVDVALAQLTKYQDRRTEDQPGYLISRRAVQSLDGLNLPEGDAKFSQVKSALENIAKDDLAAPWLRMDAMVALSEMPLSDPVGFIKQLGQLVARVAKEERKAMIVAQNQMSLVSQINEKTTPAEESKQQKAGDSGAAPAGSPSGAGTGASMSLDGGDGGRAGSGSGGSSYGNLSMFEEGGLLPYHLYYLRTNVKLATAAAQQIMGTQDRARTGLRFVQAIRDNDEARQLITDIDAQLKKLQTATDIGLVEEKELSDAERARMDFEEAELLDQPTTVRVLAEIGFRVRDLEALVGEVKVEGEEEVDMAVNASKLPAAEDLDGEAPAGAEGAEEAASEEGATSDDPEAEQPAARDPSGAPTGGSGDGQEDGNQDDTGNG